MNDMYIWGGIIAAVVVLAWLWWPKKEEPAKLDEAKEEPKVDPVAAPVNPQITDAVTQAKPKKTTAPVKKAPAKKAAAKSGKKMVKAKKK